MEPVLISVYTDMSRRDGCSADDIACDPVLRKEFLSRCWESLGSERPEKVLLKGLANLRRKSKLPRSRELHAA